MSSFDDVSWQTNAEGSLQEASSGRSMYYNGPAHLRMFPVSFGSPHISLLKWHGEVYDSNRYNQPTS